MDLDPEPESPFDPDSDPGFDPLESGRFEPPDEPDDLPPVICWRCGKLVEPAHRCPHCRAKIGSEPAHLGPGGPGVPEEGPLDPIDAGKVAGRIIGIYACLMALSVAGGLVIRHMQKAGAGRPDLAPVLLIEVIDSFLVLAALVVVPTRRKFRSMTIGSRAAGWVAGGLLMTMGLAANFAYGRWLVTSLGLEIFKTDLVALFGWGPMLIGVICVQPAIFEELFFRHLVLDNLRETTGRETAVLVSAVMFGLAHIGTPLHMPVLILLGFILGYARILGGSLLLPMILHFLHNLSVLALSANA